MNAAQREEFLEQSKAHFAADELLKGTYGHMNGQFRGCSIGCHLHHIRPRTKNFDAIDDKHGIVAKHYGYPAWLALLQDTVFEGLPRDSANHWHVQLAETLHKLPDEYDWQRALHRVHAAILRVSLQTAGSASEAVTRVLDLHERAGRGEDVSDELWSAAESAAWSAARSAAESAARSAAESAAESAARSAAWSAAWSAAESAAWSAAESAAESAARSAAFERLRDSILLALKAEAA